MTVLQHLSDQAVQDWQLGAQGHRQAPLTVAKKAAGMHCGSWSLVTAPGAQPLSSTVDELPLQSLLSLLASAHYFLRFPL